MQANTKKFNRSSRYMMGNREAGRLDFKLRRALPRYNFYIVGIDEAGRGPLAGPVVVAGIKFKVKNAKLKVLRNIRDSKKLSVKKRDDWFEILTSHPQIKWAVAKVFPKTIDRINIARAANLGVLRVYHKLSKTSTNNESPANILIRKFVRDSLFVDKILLDGGLKLPVPIPYEAIIKGDERIPAIAAASIVAKVTRDRIMCRLHKKYPQYRFDLHKGYGTKLHLGRIGLYGLSTAHRKSFRIVSH